MRRLAITTALLWVSILSTALVFGQGTIYGDLEIRNDYYVRDFLIMASNTAQYDNQSQALMLG